MAEDQYNAAVDGQEFAVSDANALGTVAGLADDRVLAELLRLTPYDGTNVYKTILPYGTLPIEGSMGATAINNGTVQPSGNADGRIVVQPFRAIAGSRSTAGTSPLQNWRDIRSGVFVGPTALAQAFLLAANGSGNPRWDLVYATISVDVASGNQTRRVKAPSTGAVTANTETTKLTNPVVVTVLTGTPGESPTVPALPADSGGNYNIALAAVRVPDGFSGTSTVANQDIRDQVKISALQSPTMGTGRLCPASGNNDQAGTYGTDTSGPGVWTPGTSGQRPGVFLAPGMVGGESRIIQVDLTTAAHPSHAIDSVVDDTIDWRNRYFRTIGQSSWDTVASRKFGSDPTGGIGLHSRFPTGAVNALASAASGIVFDIQLGNSFSPDNALRSNSCTIWTYSGNGTNGMTNAAIVGLYVDSTTGILKWWNNGTASSLRFFFWLDATGPFPNT